MLPEKCLHKRRRWQVTQASRQSLQKSQSISKHHVLSRLAHVQAKHLDDEVSNNAFPLASADLCFHESIQLRVWSDSRFLLPSQQLFQLICTSIKPCESNFVRQKQNPADRVHRQLCDGSNINICIIRLWHMHLEKWHAFDIMSHARNTRSDLTGRATHRQQDVPKLFCLEQICAVSKPSLRHKCLCEQ